MSKLSERPLRQSFDVWRSRTARTISGVNAEGSTRRCLLTWQENASSPPEEILVSELDRENPRAGFYHLQVYDSVDATIIDQSSIEKRADNHEQKEASTALSQAEAWRTTLEGVTSENVRLRHLNKQVEDENEELRRQVKILRDQAHEGGLVDETTAMFLMQLADHFFGTQDLRKAIAMLFNQLEAKDPKLLAKIGQKAPEAIDLLNKVLHGVGLEDASTKAPKEEPPTVRQKPEPPPASSAPAAT